MPKVVEKPLPPELSGRRLLTPKQAQEILGVSKRKLWEMTFKWQGADRLPSYKIGNSRKYRYDQLAYYVDIHEEPAR